MQTATIIDENGNLAEAELREYRFGLVAIVEGRYLLPDAFYVLADAQVALIKLAEARAQGLALF